MDKKELIRSIKRDIDFTSGNYAQMYKRLKLNDSASRFFVVYYSTVSIMYGLFPLFFEDKIVSSAMLNFLMISLSIIVLIASLLISFAQYGERSKKVMNGLDQLKRLKKLLQYEECASKKDKHLDYPKFIKEYHEIVDNVELRSDIDYFHACKELYSSGKYRESWHQISYISKFIMYAMSILKCLFFLLLLLFPIIVLFVVF
jgi:hypothetical protein